MSTQLWFTLKHELNVLYFRVVDERQGLTVPVGAYIERLPRESEIEQL